MTRSINNAVRKAAAVMMAAAMVIGVSACGSSASEETTAAAETEAEEFYKEFSGELEDLNAYLEKNGHSTFYVENERRYLCENCEYTFRLEDMLRFSKAGYKTKYYLRPIKTIRLKAQK